MKVKASGSVTSTALEYFLYAIIIVETATAAFAYKTVSRAAQLWPGGIAYLGLLYFGVLAWVFFQLNNLHRKRKAATRPAAAEQPQLTAPVALLLPPAAITVEPEAARVAVASVPALAPAIPDQPGASQGMDPREAVATANARTLAFGLTRNQLMFVVLVFFAGLKVFSWAIANFMK
jgi:hypothetical protein